MRIKPTCNRKDCVRTATRRPILCCWTVGDNGLKLPSRRGSIEVGFAACERHANEMTSPDWFVSAESWPVTRLSFARQLAEPDPASLTVEWVRLH